MLEPVSKTMLKEEAQAAPNTAGFDVPDGPNISRFIHS